MADFRDQTDRQQDSGQNREQGQPELSGHNRQTRPAQDRQTSEQSQKTAERPRKVTSNPDADDDMERDEMGDDRDDNG